MTTFMSRVLVMFVFAIALCLVVPQAWGDDCNGNGVPDEFDILGGTSDDNNGNSVPDECEFDCVADVYGKLVASDGAAYDRFGLCVSVSGDVAVIGAPCDEDHGWFTGAAYLYRYDGSAWVEETKLTASDGAAHDHFGDAVSVSGDVAMIGARGDDGSSSRSGSVYVYRYNGSAWVKEAKLTAASHVFGSSVSLDGDVAVIGAYGDDDNGANSGAAYVFRYNGSTWVEEAKLTASDGATYDWLGYSVSLSGDVAVIGAYGDNDNGPDSGSAYVFRREGSTWVEEAKLLASDGAAQDCFGNSVSLSGETVLIGAQYDDDNGPQSGSAYVFRYNGSVWKEEAKLTASDGMANDEFGTSVSISGKLAIVGAYGDNDTGLDSGSAYVFRYDGSRWTEATKLTAFDSAGGGCFGRSVSLSGDLAVIGADGDDENGDSSGSAYVLRGLLADCNDNGATDVCDIAVGTSADCNINGRPDECDLAGATSQDVNDSGIPDECEDCNTNGVLDNYDIAAGTSGDCDANTIPDECEPREDCQSNGVQDICDVAAGTSEDCNVNRIPDECEPLEDCQSNGVQDICDIAAGTSEDNNRDGVPDECVSLSGDFDGDGDVDLDDFDAWEDCLSGPGVTPELGCEPADFDEDDDVDLEDFAFFQRAFTGPVP